MEQFKGIIRREAPRRLWIYDLIQEGRIDAAIILEFGQVLINHGVSGRGCFAWAEFWCDLGKPSVICIDVLEMGMGTR